MDRSMDSIGSCSLDVDADSSELSDTSGSLNFPTPLSVKDITREFTSNIRERCTVRSAVTPLASNTTAIVDPVTGQVRMVLTPPTATATTTTSTSTAILSHEGTTIATLTDGTTTTKLTAKRIQYYNTGAPNIQLSEENERDEIETIPSGVEKKPSYLNLACCVNGYSNLTTYDSKIRQDINKSREVSPIRPSVGQALQYCKKNNALAPPVLHVMPHTTQPSSMTTILANGHNNNHNNHNNHNHNNSSKQTWINMNRHDQNGGIVNNCNSYNDDTCNENENVANDNRSAPVTVSVIQQRVERLYGPGALAQGFYSPKKTSNGGIKSGGSSSRSQKNNNNNDKNGGDDELLRKFHERSPTNRDYAQFCKKLDANVARTGANVSNGSGSGAGGGLTSVLSEGSVTISSSSTTTVNGVIGHKSNIDLPCLRHLPQEFLAQLPSISPKRQYTRNSPPTTPQQGNAIRNEMLEPTITPSPVSNGMASSSSTCPASSIDVKDIKQLIVDVVDHKVAPDTAASIKNGDPIVDIDTLIVDKSPKSPTNTRMKDGNQFLELLRAEQVHLLKLAVQAEKYLEMLNNNPDVNEDTLGFLRSAAGKARLLVTQKMKQFEGLCYNNLKHSPEEKFPTTVDDLQGFWDMVHLQVDNVNMIFEEIEIMRNNNWKRPTNTAVNYGIGSKKTATPKAAKQTTTKSNGCSTAANGKGDKVSAQPSVAALKREAQRKQLLEMKRKNRQALSSIDTSTDIISSTSMELSSSVCSTNNSASTSITTSANNSNINNTTTTSNNSITSVAPATTVGINSIEILFENKHISS